jgi:signal transduction histidine kinase
MPTSMSDQPSRADLDSLRATLEKLQSYHLPVETRALLQQALQRLIRLEEYLAGQQEQSRLAALYRLSRALGTSLDLNQVLDQVMDAVIGLTKAERGFLILLDKEAHEWRFQAARNLNQETLQHRDMKVSRTVIKTVLLSGRGIVTTDAQTDPRFARQDSVVLFALRSILCAPLLIRGLVIGAIYVDNRAHTGLFTQDDLHLLEAFAAQAAIAIENASLYTRTDQALARRVSELEAINRSIQMSDEAKSRFISIVSHELRTPMTSIKGYTDLLAYGAAGMLNEKQQGYLDIIQRNIQRMTVLVSDLSDISSIETGKLILECTPILLQAFMEDTLHSLRPHILEKNQTLSIELQAGLPPACADPNRLGQILTNLLDNACKYTPAGGSIRVAASQVGDCMRLEITDNGIGISAEDQTLLFTQFFRSENPIVRTQQGWGLGLSVTRRLVELMGGSIGVQSEPGRGSSFWFTIPVARG